MRQMACFVVFLAFVNLLGCTSSQRRMAEAEARAVEVKVAISEEKLLIKKEYREGLNGIIQDYRTCLQKYSGENAIANACEGYIRAGKFFNVNN